MPYRYSHYFRYGNSSNCVTGNYWWPGGGGDFNDSVRNSVTSAYMSLFGRYGELAGVEGYVGTWVYGNGPTLYGSIYNMVRNGGVSSGELSAVQSNGRHTNMSIGSCPPPVVYGCRDPQADNYNPSATADSTCTYSLASVSLTRTPASLILEDGGTYTLTWSISSKSTIYSRQLYLNGGLNRNLSSNSGSLTLSPSTGTDLTYQLRVTNKAGTAYSANANIAVYVKPQVTLSTDDADNTIVQGESLNLYWVTTGDASTLTIEPGIGASNLVSNVPISPTVTTTYTASASGSGGSGSDELTVTVLPPPSVSVNGPTSADYGSSITVTCDGTNVPTSFKVTPHYYNLDGDLTVGDDVTLPIGDNVSEDVTFDTIPWDARGPSIIDFVVTAVGYGGLTASDIHVVSIDIDRTPDLIVIPESIDKFKSEDPVISPLQESLIQVQVTDIDIPVPVKSDSPVKVEIDGSGLYTNVEEI